MKLKKKIKPVETVNEVKEKIKPVDNAAGEVKPKIKKRRLYQSC